MLYKTRLDQKLEDKNFDSTEKHYNHIKECIHNAALESLGKYDNTNQRKSY